MTAQFQQAVNIYNPLGIIGEMAFTGPERSIPANVNSNGAPNNFGYVYTFTSPATAEPSLAAPNGATVQVGGTGVFAGIMTGVKQAYLSGTTAGGPLGASLVALDNSVQQFTQMGYPFVPLPGPANPGDLVTYDPLTGALNSITPTTTFTASIAPGGAATPDVLTVSAVSAGILAVGQIITGSTVAGGTYIQSLGSGTGYTGTYNLSTINEQTVTSRAMTAPNVPAPAFAASAAYITTSVGIDTLHITTLTSGEVLVGQQVFGTNVAPDTVITAFGSGTGGTGSYTLNTSGQVVASSGSPEAMTGPANLFVPRATVERYAANTAGGAAVIKLTN